VALFGKSEIKSGGGKKKKKPTKGTALTSEQQQERERVSELWSSSHHGIMRVAHLSLYVYREWSQVNNLRHAHKIRVKGGDVPAPITSFAELEASMRAYLLRNIETAGYTTPTPIQMQSIPILLHGRELMAIAPTGSGKTAAYVLPILSKLKQPEKVGFRAVIVSPTRELAQQIYRELRKLSKGKEFRICVLTKANANENSLSATTRFDILVTTPMRLVHLLRSESLKLDSVEHLVLDEADKLLDMGFMEQVDEIIAACTNQAVQRSLWSATMSPIIEDLARTFLRDPVHLTIGTRDAATTTIKQRLEFVGREDGKLLMLRQMITQVREHTTVLR
jgi:ATP-dependent RNA helicase DDX52/ROK1